MSAPNLFQMTLFLSLLQTMMNAPCMAHAAKPAPTPMARTGAAARKDTSYSLTGSPAEPDKVSRRLHSQSLPSNQLSVNNFYVKARELDLFVCLLLFFIIMLN